MMRHRILTLVLAAALLFAVVTPAASQATADNRFENARLTFLTRDLTEQDLGLFRGVYAEFGFGDFTAEEIIPVVGAVVVQLHDSRDRVVAVVRSRAGVFVDKDYEQLSVPIDSVWGTFDYDRDGYWTQPRNQRINGGNCGDIAYAIVSVALGDGEGGIEELATRIDGPPKGSCDDIRR